MKEMLKLGLALALFSTAACVGLAFVYEGTSKIIADREQADLEASLDELFPGMDSFEDITGSLESPNPAVEFQTVYKIQGGGALLGLAVRASGTSYGGALTTLTGVSIDGRVTRVKILSHKDTPGLGANAASDSYYVDRAKKITFTGQFSGKSFADPFLVKEDVLIVTASTITSRAVANIVKASSEAVMAYIQQGASS